MDIDKIKTSDYIGENPNRRVFTDKLNTSLLDLVRQIEHYCKIDKKSFLKSYLSARVTTNGRRARIYLGDPKNGIYLVEMDAWGIRANDK